MHVPEPAGNSICPEGHVAGEPPVPLELLAVAPPVPLELVELLLEVAPPVLVELLEVLEVEPPVPAPLLFPSKVTSPRMLVQPTPRDAMAAIARAIAGRTMLRIRSSLSCRGTRDRRAG
jgi:hypothetical protein